MAAHRGTVVDQFNGRSAKAISDMIAARLGPTTLRSGQSDFSATEVVRGKPAPDLFLYAAAKMGVPAAACVVANRGARSVVSQTIDPS